MPLRNLSNAASFVFCDADDAFRIRIETCQGFLKKFHEMCLQSRRSVIRIS
jgi:hypothetical protein